MSQQLDKLFSDKMRHYQKQAPAGAWERIEANLEKKTRHKFPWWQVAACVLFIMTMGYLTWFYAAEKNQPAIANAEQPHVAEPADKDQTTPEVIESSEVATSEQREVEAPVRHREIEKPKLKRSYSNIVSQPLAQALPESNKVLPESQPADNQTVDVAAVPPERENNDRSMKFTISTDESDKYLNKTALAQATSEDRRPSTFKKLLKKANDLKSNQDPFGDLREKKNEILALNFKSDKRGQNK
jgi:hypothetical protein